MLKQKFQAGFLEECAGSDLPFIGTAPGGNPPIVVAKISGAINSPADAFLNWVTVGSSAPRLRCNITAGGQLLFSREDFVNAVEYEVDGWIHGFVANSISGAYFSYVMPLNSSFYSNPTNSYPLTPFCVEPHVGSVAISVSSDNAGQISIPTDKPLLLTEGYNYNLDYSSDVPVGVTFGVEVGAGEGLQPCPDDGTVSSYIRSINLTGADEKGNFQLTAPPAECITVNSNAPGAANLNSHCAPCCRCKDYKSVSNYSRSQAAELANLIKTFNELVTKYNRLATGFNSRISCCPAADKLTPRFRLWPQQNFKLQIQAMAENNTGSSIRMNELKLVSSLTTAFAISATDSGGEVYSMTAGQAIACLPIANSSYVYFKTVNPSSNGLSFDITGPGVLESRANLVQAVAGNSSGCSVAGEHSNDLPTCTGYTMLTAGIVIVDPIFRKIVNLLKQDVLVNLNLVFGYVGKPGCTGSLSYHAIADVNKSVFIGPNKQSVNPCPSAKGSYLTTEDGNIKIKFSDMVHGSGSLTADYKVLAGDTWETVFSQSIPVVGNGESEYAIGSIPYDSLDSGTYKLEVSYASGGGLVTKCKALDTPDDEFDIPASSFTVGASFFV